MVQDEPREDDNTYIVDNIKFIVNKEVEKDVSHIEIDYEKEWWGEDFTITAGF